MKALWLAELQNYRNGTGHPDVIHKPFPVMPWITPKLNQNIWEVVLRVGQRRHFPAGQTLFGYRQPVNHLVVVERGLVSRSINAPEGQAISVAPPMHIGCGNLNFFSSRACFGKYATLSEADLIFCDKTLLLKVLLSDPSLLMDFNVQLELCTLSDRLAFSCLSVLNAEQRLKAFTCAWAVNYGILDRDFRTGEDWVKMPFPLTRQLRALLINSSENWVDAKIRQWREDGLWHRKAMSVWFRLSLLDDIYRWLREREEGSTFESPKTLKEIYDSDFDD